MTDKPINPRYVTVNGVKIHTTADWKYGELCETSSCGRCGAACDYVSTHLPDELLPNEDER